MKELTVQIKESAFHCEYATSLSTMHHLHKEIEIIYVRDGRSTAFVDNKAVEIATGDLLLVCPNQIHYYEDSSSGLYQILIFSTDILFEMQSLFRKYQPAENVFHLTADSFSAKILGELTAESPRYQHARQAGLVNCLMAELLSTVEMHPYIGFTDKTIKTILAFCEENYNQDISLQQMADALHMNKTYVSRIFNQKIQQNFKTYITTLRITKACELLQDTENSISDVSEEVGFGSFRTFNRAFSAMMGMSPSEYRKSLKYLP